jgi:hypothetical protein
MNPFKSKRTILSKNTYLMIINVIYVALNQYEICDIIALHAKTTTYAKSALRFDQNNTSIGIFRK